jgi:hypothetical protein
MANITISGLASAATIAPTTDQIPIVAASVTKKVTPSILVNSVLNSAANVGIGTSTPNASAILDAQSTTKGVRFPNMTTLQKTAVATPAAGLVVFDTTLAKLCVYSGTVWQTITSTT